MLKIRGRGSFLQSDRWKEHLLGVGEGLVLERDLNSSMMILQLSSGKLNFSEYIAGGGETCPSFFLCEN